MPIKREKSNELALNSINHICNTVIVVIFVELN